MDIKQRKCRFRKELQQSMQTWWNAKEQWQQKLSVCLSEKEFVETKKKMEQVNQRNDKEICFGSEKSLQ